MVAVTRIVSLEIEGQLRALSKLRDLKSGVRIISVSSFDSSSSSDSNDTIDMPEILESRETLDFLGFSPAFADSIWARHEAATASRQGEEVLEGFEDMPGYSFLTGIKGGIREGVDAFGPDGDWYGVMTSIGVGRALQERMMDPAFEAIRYTATAQEWVLETVMDIYEFLENLNRNIFTVAKRGGRQGLSSDGASSTSRDRIVTPSGLPFSAIRPTPPGHFMPPTAQPQVTPDTETPKLAPWERFLYKGGHLAKLQRVLPDQPSQPAMAIEIATHGRADFSNTTGWYSTKDLHTAEKYAEYAKRRSDNDWSAEMLTLAVSDALISNPVAVEGEIWQQYVWWNRLRGRVTRPNAVNHLEAAPLLVGPILSMDTSSVLKLFQQGGTCRDLKPLNFVGSDSAHSQYTFKDPDTIEEWACKSRVWVNPWSTWSECKDKLCARGADDDGR